MDVDELQQLKLEVSLISHPGWQLRRTRLMSRLEQEGRGLLLGTITEDRERERAIGRCQVLKDLLDIDEKLQEEWRMIMEESEERHEEKEEGGDLGVHYDMAQ